MRVCVGFCAALCSVARRMWILRETGVRVLLSGVTVHRARCDDECLERVSFIGNETRVCCFNKLFWQHQYCVFFFGGDGAYGMLSDDSFSFLFHFNGPHLFGITFQ